MTSFHSTGARLAAWAWMIFAVFNLADIAYRGRDRSSAVAAAVLLLGCGCAYVLGLRPKVVGDNAGVRVVNLLRTYTLPWSSVREISAGRVLTLTYDGGTVEAWAVQTSARPMARAKRKKPDAPVPDAPVPDRIAEAIKDRTPVDFATEQLTELKARSKGTGQPSVAWAPLAIASLAVPLLAVVVLAVAGLTTGVNPRTPRVGR